MNSPVLVKDRPGHAPRRRAAADGYQHSAVLRHLCHAIGGTLKAFAEGAAEARRAARAYEQLTAMSEPELHDIGINRSDIPAVAFGRYRRTLPPISGRPDVAGQSIRHRPESRD